MAMQGSVGAAVAVSTTLPTTHDTNETTGFPSVTPTPVGRISSVPDLRGTFDVATFDDLTTGEEIKEPDVYRAGNGSFEVALDDEDAGQAALEAAEGTKVALRFTLKSGVIYWRIGILTSVMPSGIATGGFVRMTVNVEFEKETVKIPAPST